MGDKLVSLKSNQHLVTMPDVSQQHRNSEPLLPASCFSSTALFPAQSFPRLCCNWPWLRQVWHQDWMFVRQCRLCINDIHSRRKCTSHQGKRNQSYVPCVQWSSSRCKRNINENTASNSLQNLIRHIGDQNSEAKGRYMKEGRSGAALEGLPKWVSPSLFAVLPMGRCVLLVFWLVTRSFGWKVLHTLGEKRRKSSWSRFALASSGGRPTTSYGYSPGNRLPLIPPLLSLSSCPFTPLSLPLYSPSSSFASSSSSSSFSSSLFSSSSSSLSFSPSSFFFSFFSCSFSSLFPTCQVRVGRFYVSCPSPPSPSSSPSPSSPSSSPSFSPDLNMELPIAVGSAGSTASSRLQWAAPDLTRGAPERTGQRRTSPGELPSGVGSAGPQLPKGMSKDMSEICQPRMSEDMSEKKCQKIYQCKCHMTCQKRRAKNTTKNVRRYAVCQKKCQKICQ